MNLARVKPSFVAQMASFVPSKDVTWQLLPFLAVQIESQVYPFPSLNQIPSLPIRSPCKNKKIIFLLINLRFVPLRLIFWLKQIINQKHGRQKSTLYPFFCVWKRNKSEGSKISELKESNIKVHHVLTIWFAGKIA